MQDKLDSANSVVKAAGLADFVFCNGDDRVCLQIKAHTPSNEHHEMADGFAQVVVEMEVQNRRRIGDDINSVGGIVSNYLEWTFIKIEYAAGGGKPIPHNDQNMLVSRSASQPTDHDLARIVGKVMSVCGVQSICQ